MRDQGIVWNQTAARDAHLPELRTPNPEAEPEPESEMKTSERKNSPVSLPPVVVLLSGHVKN